MQFQPPELTPQQRMAQVAAILARGVLRLKQDALRDAPSPPKESPPEQQKKP